MVSEHRKGLHAPPESGKKETTYVLQMLRGHERAISRLT